MRILIVVDKFYWAYHSIALALQKYSGLDISIIPLKKNEAKIKEQVKRYDRVLIMGWQLCDRLGSLDFKKTLTGLHSFHSWDNKKTTPDVNAIPPKSLIAYLRKFRKVNAVSLRLYDLFKKNGLSNVMYTPNGVDTDIFEWKAILPNREMSVGYSGSKAHDWRKGLTQFILPAAKQAGVNAKVAMLSSNKYVSLENMPKFYHEIDCYICASSSEGFSLSTLEAASCGRPVISTRVSGTEELIRDGLNGFLVDRSVDHIAEKIRYLKHNRDILAKMGANMRSFVKTNYDWAKVIHHWVSFLTD